MTGNDNPYAGSFGNQMTASASFGGQPAAAAAPGRRPDQGNDDRQLQQGRAGRLAPAACSRRFLGALVRTVQAADPVIEKVVTEAAGRVKLVKMNIDDHPSIAGQLGIQSIPAVIAFVGGRPVDGFMGAVPESQIKQFIEKIAGPAVDDSKAEIEAALADAKALLEAGDAENAAGLFGAVLQADPENAVAIAGMVDCMITLGQIAEAREALYEPAGRSCQGCRHQRDRQEARPDRGSPQARRSERPGTAPGGKP